MDPLVLRDGVFDRPRYQLLDLLRRRARPGTTGDGNSDWDVRVFALGHGLVAEPAPDQNANQQHPGNLWVFHEESRNVPRLFDSFLIAFMCHGLSAYGITERESPSFRSCAPIAATFSPARTPATETELPWVAPTVTRRTCALHWPACCSATTTANCPDSPGYGTMALNGTDGCGASRFPPSSIEAIIPGLRMFLWFGTVTSIANTRLRTSALGEILVTRPEYWAAPF